MSKIKIWRGYGQGFPHNDLNERYTPAKYVNAARKVMGDINLDPASCYFANLIVKADIYYDEVQNGLSKPWFGRVWMNPPFSGNLADWLYHLVAQYKCGNVTQAICLYPAAGGVLSTGWFHQLLVYPMCIPFKRVCYYREDDIHATGHPPFSSVFSYLGPNEAEFAKVFRKFGDIVKKVG